MFFTHSLVLNSFYKKYYTEEKLYIKMPDLLYQLSENN
jgi:hypothetical protein